MIFKLLISLLLLSSCYSSEVKIPKNTDHTESEVISPVLKVVIDDLSDWCNERGITLHITSLIRSEAENERIGAISDTHIEGRAVDFSIKSEYGWTDKLINDMVTYLEEKYGHLGAVTEKGISRLIVIHDAGLGLHVHIQIRKGL